MVVVDWYQPPYAHSYKRGVFREDPAEGPLNLAQGGNVPNHASVLLGWGTSANSEKYWILRNTFGPEWGENGDMRLERGAFGVGLSISGFDVEFVDYNTAA